MRLILDADGLIKLHRAGVLAMVASVHNCTIPVAVYQEAITQGKAFLYPDAEAIELIVNESIEVRQTPELATASDEAESRLGVGERAALRLYDEQGEAIISDDRYFLGFLARRGIPFLTPVALIVLLLRDGALEFDEARAAFERVRPSVREAVYLQAMNDLERVREGK